MLGENRKIPGKGFSKPPLWEMACFLKQFTGKGVSNFPLYHMTSNKLENSWQGDFEFAPLGNELFFKTIHWQGGFKISALGKGVKLIN